MFLWIRYGPGPYTVEFTVLLEGEKYYFSVETAPNHLLPHSVYTFMSMVETKAWDRSMFFFSDFHRGIVISSVHEVDGVPVNSELTSQLLFPEYSAQFPHVSHTLGFGGRPGGPNFYINLMDNSSTHGPGGQRNHDLSEEADTCFAKITHGQDIVKLINESISRRSFHCEIESIRHYQTTNPGTLSPRLMGRMIQD